MSLTSIQNECVSRSRSITPIHSVPLVKETSPSDPNMANPRFLINRALIYERRLPGDAYITAHVQRLQHGYYSTDVVSDADAEYVDFLAIAFTFHSPHTITHRIKSASIKVSILGNRELSSSKYYTYGYPPGNPRFLMHAPHLLYGTVSPETMEWTFSLAGSLGISEMPLSASVIPSGSVNSRYKRYEMMRVQGSARTLKSELGSEFNVESGMIVWSMEENNVQRSGLPREFTFVMLVQKPSPQSKISLSIEVDPVIDAMLGSYPSLMLKLPEYQPLARRGVDFQQEVGQRFEPVDPVRGFNFATLGSMFDEYIAMPGRKYSRQIQIPVETGIPEDHVQAPFPGQYGPLNPNPYQQLQAHNLALQNNSLSLQNSLLQTTVQNLWTTQSGGDDIQSHNQQAASSQNRSRAAAPQVSHPAPTSPSTMLETAAITIPVNLRICLDPNNASQLTNLARASPGNNPLAPHRTPSLRRRRVRDVSSTRMTSGASTGSEPSPTDSMIPHTGAGGRLSEIAEGDSSGEGEGEEELRQLPKTPMHTPETARRVARRDATVGASPVSRRVRGPSSSVGYTTASSHRRVMSLVNSPLSTSLISALAER